MKPPQNSLSPRAVLDAKGNQDLSKGIFTALSNLRKIIPICYLENRLVLRELFHCTITKHIIQLFRDNIFLQIHLIKNTLNSWTEFSIKNWCLLTLMYRIESTDLIFLVYFYYIQTQPTLPILLGKLSSKCNTGLSVENSRVNAAYFKINLFIYLIG